MDKDLIYRTFQEICRQVTVVILGAGASCEAGLPGMQDLAKHLLEDLPKDINGTWSKISSDLEKGIDLETALNRTKPDENLSKDIIKIVGRYISEKDREARERYFNRQMTIPVERLLDYYRSENLTIITPNYDCLVEYCCDELKIHCNTGFVGYFRKVLDFEKAGREVEYVDKSVIVRGKRRRIEKTTPHVKLFKVHGSIDWYNFNNSSTVSDIFLIENEKYEDKRLMILPGDRKYSEAFHEPYRELIQKADNSLRSGRSFLMIGYGFNDEHLQEILVKRLKEDQKPGIIITKELSEKAQRLLSVCPNLWGVSQKNSATVIQNGENEYEISDELWRIDEFISIVLGG